MRVGRWRVVDGSGRPFPFRYDSTHGLLVIAEVQPGIRTPGVSYRHFNIRMV